MSQILNRIEREMRHRQRTRAQVWIRRVSIGALLVAIPLISGELALRLFGFVRPQIDFSAQEKSLKAAAEKLNERFSTSAFQFDPHLFWKLKPGSNLGGLKVDSAGLLSWDRVSQGPRQALPLRVVCLGDSVSAMTYRTFPEIAEMLAAAGTTPKPIQFINAAVPGYTTEQGLRSLEKIQDLKPDVVIFCFGWNDHFPALSLPDRELGAANAAFAFIHDSLKDVRLYQLAGAPLGTKVTGTKALAPDASSGSGNDSTFRVGPSQFKANLEEMIATVRGWKAKAVLATQPEHLKGAAEGFLEQNKFVAPEGRDNQGLHTQYNGIIRQVAVSRNAPLLDLEEEFIRRPRDFMLEPDGIHLTGRGHNHVARLVLGMMRNEGLISSADYDSIARAEKHDTTAPDKPRISWSLTPDYVAATAGSSFSFSAIPQNSGNTRWLRQNLIQEFGNEKNVSYGSSSIYARWRTMGSPEAGIVSKVPIPSDILPGEATSVTMTLKAPPTPGNYEMEVGIYVDRIGPLSQYGAESTTLTVTSIAPQ